ncbi:MAG: dethiobiotin synthase [Kofleriaceae bacterium]|nr:dethiobiotin synthase [Kofleriaceae bacterium]
MQGYFVTGTDTGVGKTFTSAALASRARVLGKRVFAFKPIETGCQPPEGEDQRILSTAAGDWQTGALRGLYQLSQPVAPLVAAEAEHRVIDLDLIDVTIRESAPHADLVIVEGAGGWRVPITPTIDMAAFARRLGLPVIVVARATLGTINHSLLTLEAVERDGCSVAALVLSRHPSDDPDFTASNAHEIGRRWKGQIITLAEDASVLDRLFAQA